MTKYFRGMLFGEQGAGKTATTDTLTADGNCLLRTRALSQYTTLGPGVQIHPQAERAYTIEEYLKFIEDPAKVFKGTIKTIIVDDLSAIEIIGLDDYGIRDLKDKRKSYHELQVELAPRFIDLASGPWNLIVVAQAKKVQGERGELIEIIPDLSNKISNIVLASLDYCFYVNRATEFGQPPTLQLWGNRRKTKLRLRRDQWANPPVQKQERANLAEIWKKLQAPSGVK